MISASKTTFCLNNLKILRPKVSKKSYQFVGRTFVNSHTVVQKSRQWTRNLVRPPAQIRRVLSILTFSAYLDKPPFMYLVSSLPSSEEGSRKPRQQLPRLQWEPRQCLPQQQEPGQKNRSFETIQ